MQKARTESRVTPYSCPIAGRTVYIRRTWNLSADGSVCSVKAVCDNQDGCILARRAAA
jgi:hypothetical protein